MPELPEIETTKNGIKPHLETQIISRLVVRNPKLRWPIPSNLEELCCGKIILTVSRRAKYLLIKLSEGYLLIHLGMSGHLRIVTPSAPVQKHDHFDLILGNNTILRYCDPRRFGLILYLEKDPFTHPLLAHLGPEPLSEDFSSAYLLKQAQNKKQPIKSLIMNNEVVVGIGNIYATESLFLANLHPQTPAGIIPAQSLHQLTTHIKETIQRAINAGGTTLRDFYSSEGKPGYFSIELKVYGRRKQACFVCNTLIESIIIAGRHSAFCPQCQPIDQ